DHGRRYEYVDLAALEACHGDFLLVGAEAPVQQAEAQAGERAGAEVFVHLGCGAEFCSFGFIGRAFSPPICFATLPGASPQAGIGPAYGPCFRGTLVARWLCNGL